MIDASPMQTETPRKNLGCFSAGLIFLLALLTLGTGLVFYFGESAKDFFSNVTGSFFKTETKTSAQDILLEIGRTHGDVLEVASPLKTMEFFHRADNRFAAWGWVYLGTTTSEIKVPATYRFHIKLSELHHARIDNGVLFITVKALHPSLPVAFDSTGLEKKSEDTWLRFDAPQQLQELEKSITPALEKRALDHLNNIREVARKDVEEFVQKWIVDARPDFRDQVVAVKVLFAGEKDTPIPSPVLP